MIVSSPIPRGKQPKYHESSYLQSFRENDSTPRQWIRAKTSGYNGGGQDRQIAVLTQQMNRMRRRIPGGSGSSSGTGMFFKGEYSGEAYSTQNVVEFVPDGQSAGFYIALKTVPAGQSPDVGFPYWMAFPAPAPGQWA